MVKKIRLRFYGNLKVQLFIITQVPMQTIKPEKLYINSLVGNSISEELLHKHSIPQEKHARFQGNINDFLKSEASKYDNIFIIDPTEKMCNTDNCPIGTIEHSYYFDKDHLSIKGANNLIDFLTSKLIITAN